MRYKVVVVAVVVVITQQQLLQVLVDQVLFWFVIKLEQLKHKQQRQLVVQ